MDCPESDLRKNAVVDAEIEDSGGAPSSSDKAVGSGAWRSPVFSIKGVYSGACRFLEFSFEKPERKPRGAPSKIANHLARWLHVRMAGEHYQEGKNAARLRVAEVLSIGNREQPENVVRQFILSEKKASDFLRQGGFGDALVYSPSDTTPFSLIFEKSKPSFRQDESGRWCLTAEGEGWACRWGEQRAVYRLIRLNGVLDGSPTQDGMAYCNGW